MRAMPALAAAVAALALLVTAVAADPQRPRPAPADDAGIVAAIIAASIATYRAATSGACACPDDVDKAGRRCGGRSAHSRGGGHHVLCSPADVTPAMIAAWRQKRR